MHWAEHQPVRGLAYSAGIAGQLVTQVFVEGSLNNLAVVLQEEEHLRLVGSANYPSWQAFTHLLEEVSPNVA